MTAWQQLARMLIHLYPRAWRQRYGDELRALLAETPITPAVVFDVLICALREWVRAATRLPESPVSLDREEWRSQALTLIATVLLGWGAGRLVPLLWALGVSDDNRWWLIVPALYVPFRVLVAQTRRLRLQNRAIRQSAPPPSDAIISAGIGSLEFWICVGLIVVSTAANFADSTPRHWVAQSMRWVGLWVSIGLLRSTTRTDLARRDLVQRLYRAERGLGQVGR